jgi:hypothetical protein
MRAGSNPLLIDIARREVIHLECKCGRQVQVAPYRLIDQYDGVRPTTPVWGLEGPVQVQGV